MQSIKEMMLKCCQCLLQGLRCLWGPGGSACPVNKGINNRKLVYNHNLNLCDEFLSKLHLLVVCSFPLLSLLRDPFWLWISSSNAPTCFFLITSHWLFKKWFVSANSLQTLIPPLGFFRAAEAEQVCSWGLFSGGQMFTHVLNITSGNLCLFWSWGTLFSFTLFMNSENLSIWLTLNMWIFSLGSFFGSKAGCSVCWEDGAHNH